MCQKCADAVERIMWGMLILIWIAAGGLGVCAWLHLPKAKPDAAEQIPVPPQPGPATKDPATTIDGKPEK